MTYKKSFLVGLAQSLALVPGISRSGITMIAARGQGLAREEAARFSFLLGTPAMIGAFVFKFKDLSSADLNLNFLIGVLTSAIFGFIFIKFLLDYLKKSDFSIFAWYRLAFATILMIVYFLRG
jgi:undecaprenyl-diphosphatase